MKTDQEPAAAGGTRWPDVYERVTQRILAHLERGVAPWKRPWDAADGPPSNFTTGKPYRGVNVLLLSMEGRASPWWLTFRQAKARGGSVRKGERGTRIVKYGIVEGTPAAEDGTDAPDKARRRLFLREFTVFNACQVEGIDFPSPESSTRLPETERIRAAEAAVEAMPNPPRIFQGDAARAAYVPQLDLVEMPDFGRFHSPEAYYGTLFHELAHATGHQNRLARRSLLAFRNFADHAYSKEELVAEMGAAMLLAETGTVADEHEASASYIKSWLHVLKCRENRRWVVEAAGQAAKAADFILRRNIGPPDEAAG